MNRGHTRFQAGLATVEWLSVREPGKQFNAVQRDLYLLDVGGKSSLLCAISWLNWRQHTQSATLPL